MMTSDVKMYNLRNFHERFGFVRFSFSLRATREDVNLDKTIVHDCLNLSYTAEIDFVCWQNVGFYSVFNSNF
jgi:hypothetical protein